MMAFWWLTTENSCWEPRNGYGSIQNCYHIWNYGLGSSGYGYMASQWPRMEPVFGVSGKLTFYMEHVLQRAIAILLPYLEAGFLGEKGQFLLPFFSPRINQPQVPLPIFVMWLHCPTSPHSWGEDHITPLLFAHLRDLYPSCWDLRPGFCARGSSLVSLTFETVSQSLVSLTIYLSLCANLWWGREMRNVAYRGQEEWGWHAQDVTFLLASPSQVCHTFLEIRKSPAGV